MKISKISKHRFLQVRYFFILASQSLEKTTEVAYCPAGQFLVFSEAHEMLGGSDYMSHRVPHNLSRDPREQI